MSSFHYPHRSHSLDKGHTSLVKVYGHKRAGAALYGVRLVNGGRGLEIVDGHDPSIPALLDDQPVSRQFSGLFRPSF